MNLAKIFIIVPPGLEELAKLEIIDKSPGLNILRVEKGGLEVEAPFEIGLALNLILKIPSGILLRISEFKCRDLPKLYNKVSNIKWGQFLIGGQFELSVASSKSRLLHEKKIAGSVSEGIARHFQKQPPKKTDSKFEFEIQVRFFDDLCTISLNLSGEALYKRGYKTMSARAPIRENLAAALYYALIRELGDIEALVDPMCGSGSLLLEAHEFWSSNTSRDFAFQQKLDWKAADMSLSGSSKILNYYGFDRDEKALQDLQTNIGAITRDDRAKWTISVRDLMSDEPIQILSDKFAFICNPPYGERIRLPMPPKEFYPKLIEKMLMHHPLGVGVILPQKFLSVVPKRVSGYSVASEWSFENGGIPVVYRIYRAVA